MQATLDTRMARKKEIETNSSRNRQFYVIGYDKEKEITGTEIDDYAMNKTKSGKFDDTVVEDKQENYKNMYSQTASVHINNKKPEYGNKSIGKDLSSMHKSINKTYTLIITFFSGVTIVSGASMAGLSFFPHPIDLTLFWVCISGAAGFSIEKWKRKILT